MNRIFLLMVNGQVIKAYSILEKNQAYQAFEDKCKELNVSNVQVTAYRDGGTVERKNSQVTVRLQVKHVTQN